MITAGHDPLHGEGAACARRLVEAGLPVRHVDYPGMTHGSLQFAGATPAAREAHRAVAAVLRTAFVAPRQSASAFTDSLSEKTS